MPDIGPMIDIGGLSPEFQKAFQLAAKAEQKPLEQIAKRKEALVAKAELLGDLSNRVDTLRQTLPSLNSPFAIRDLAFNSDDPKVVMGSADKNLAEPGKHPMEVIQLAGGASALSNALPDKDTTLMGTGYVTFTTKDGDTREIYIDADNSTLEGMARTINSANLGVHASVVGDSSDPDNPYKLMVSTRAVGSGEDVEFPEFYLAGGEEDFYMDSQIDARNAIVRYQGFTIESPTNEIKDLIPGATLNLKGITDPGRPTTVTIEQDIPKTSIKMKEFVDKTNQILTFIQQQQNTRDPKENATKVLGGEYSLLLAQQRIHDALRENYFGDDARTIKTLSDLGIQFSKNGTLTYDEKKFTHALETNFDETVHLLTGDGQTSGIMTRMTQALSSLGRPGEGIVANQKAGLNAQIDALDRQSETKTKSAEQKLEQLKMTLAKAQGALSQMQNQANFFQGGGGGVPIPGM